MPKGFDKLEMLRAGGFSEEQVGQYAQKQKNILRNAQFSEKEINEHFGKKEFRDERLKDLIRKNMERQGLAVPESKGSEAVNEIEKGQVGEPGQFYAPDAKPSDSILSAFEAGFDTSVAGLQIARPDVILNENAAWYHRIASQVGTLTGDLPYMLTGSAIGGFAGGAAGVVAGGAAGTLVGGPLGSLAGSVVGGGVGSVVGAGAGSFALPEALRQTYMDAYEDGEIDDFQEFWTRVSSTLIAGAKGGVIGAATFGTGKVVGGLTKASSPLTKTAAELSAEVVTMVGVGAAIEKEIPDFYEFTDAALVIAGIRGAGFGVKKVKHYVPQKLRYIYRNTGKKPQEVAEAAMADPKVKQELLSKNNVPFRDEVLLNEPPLVEIPSNLKGLPDPKINTELSDSRAKIRAFIGKQLKVPGKKPTYAEFYKDFVDELDPIYQATKEMEKAGLVLFAEQNPYILSRMVPDAKAKAKHAFEKGTLDFNTREVNGKSLREILESVDNIDNFVDYLVSKRVVEKADQGFKTGADVNAARDLVKTDKAKYDKQAKEFVEFNNRVLEYVKDSGILSEKDLVAIKKANTDYISFRRIINNSETTEKSGVSANKSSNLKKFKGSDRQIQDPILSTLENVQDMYRIAEINRARKALVDAALELPEQTLIEKVSRKQVITVSGKEAIKTLPKVVQGLAAEIATDVNVFRSKKEPLRQNEFAVYRKGKREVYETSPEVAEALRNLGGDYTSSFLALRLMNGITRFKKLTITFVPDFIIRNFMRDYATGGVFSEGKVSPGDVLSAMGAIVRKSDDYYDWLRSGGANGAFLELGERYMRTEITKLQKQTGYMGSAKNVLRKPIDAMRVGAELAEQSLRLAEFKKVTEKTGSVVKGGFASREVTLDFQRVGAKISALNSISAFLNVSIQGLDKTVRAFKQKPGETSFRAITAITVPSVLLWWANKDDIRYQEVPDWEKDHYWIIPVDSWEDATPAETQGIPDQLVRKVEGRLQINRGTVYKFPKPMELGIVFGSLPERLLQLLYKQDATAFDGLGESFFNLVTPNFIPDAITPFAEQYANKVFFTGSDLIPHYMEKNSGPMQYREYTSDTAKTLGKLLAPISTAPGGISSPLVIDNYIRSWTGTLGQYAIDVMDEALQKAGVTPDPPEPEGTLADTPFLRSFAVRFPKAMSSSVERFYKRIQEFETAQADMNKLKRERNFDELMDFMSIEENRVKLMDISNFKKALSEQRKFINLVKQHPTWPPEEKRQLIDQAYFTMIETARKANETLDMILGLEKE